MRRDFILFGAQWFGLNGSNRESVVQMVSFLLSFQEKHADDQAVPSPSIPDSHIFRRH